MDRLVHGACIEHLRTLPDEAVTLLLTDPLYGLNMARRGQVGGMGRIFTPKDWDVAPPAQEYFDEMRRVRKHQIIWGGNMFSHLLPQSRCWLVWYKKDELDRNDFADCELAWTSFDRNSMVFNSRWSGFVKDSKEKRYAHPTQKALNVMKWCVLEFSNPGEPILEPFLGSGTTAVAAAILSRRYIGIDKEEEYIKIAEERLREYLPTTNNAA